MMTTNLKELGQTIFDRPEFADAPPYLKRGTQFLARTGSFSYGTATATSDIDLAGFCIPPLRISFPHLDGKIHGFDKDIQSFDQYMKHASQGIDAFDTEIDMTVYSLVRFFSLLIDNNPNVLDVLFVPDDCIMYQSKIAEMVRANRCLFLSKGSYYRFRGFCQSQIAKMKKIGDVGEKRRSLIDKYGYDVKFAAHAVRILLQAEQILSTGDLNLRRDYLLISSILQGTFTAAEIEEHVQQKQKEVDELFISSSLPDYPDRAKIKDLLVWCLEEFNGGPIPGFPYS
jgi:predicted nucleotidyltransferase